MSLEYILQSWIKSKIVVELLLLLPRRPTFGGFVSIRSYRLNHYRLLNLELLQNYGASMWLGHNKSEEGTEAAVASQVCHLPSPPFFCFFRQFFVWKLPMTAYKYVRYNFIKQPAMQYTGTDMLYMPCP